MIVDDSPEIIFTIKDGLEEEGSNYQIISADNGESCIDFLKNNSPPDLLLLDIMMPGMNGWKVLKRIRSNENWKNTPIVFLTAKTDEFSKGYGKIIAQEYIEKPFTIEELKVKIEQVLSKNNQNSRNKQKIIDDMINHIP